MLIDHGLDSISGFLIGMQAGHIMGVFDPFLYVAILFSFIAITFFFALWTQYSTGIFRLGRINAID